MSSPSNRYTVTIQWTNCYYNYSIDSMQLYNATAYTNDWVYNLFVRQKSRWVHPLQRIHQSRKKVCVIVLRVNYYYCFARKLLSHVARGNDG